MADLRTTTAPAATYSGPRILGAAGTGEVLEAGDAVRVVKIRRSGAIETALVDKASDAFGTGRTYTVWPVMAGDLRA